jgi:hypothetical protein
VCDLGGGIVVGWSSGSVFGGHCGLSHISMTVTLFTINYEPSADPQRCDLDLPVMFVDFSFHALKDFDSAIFCVSGNLPAQDYTWCDVGTISAL